jgi:hypothetical protein
MSKNKGKKPTGQRPYLGKGPRTPTGSGPEVDDILEQERFQKAPRHVQDEMVKETKKKAAKKASKAARNPMGRPLTPQQRALLLAELAEDATDLDAQRVYQKTGNKKVAEKMVKDAAEKVAKAAAKVGGRHLSLAPLGALGQMGATAMDVSDLVSMFMDAVPSKKEEAKADKKSKAKQNRRLAAKRRRAMKEGAVGLPESPALSQTDDPGK